MTRYTHTDRSDGDVIGETDWNLLSSAMASDSIAPGYVVAPSTAPEWMQDAAHYVCDGTADEVEIQAADAAAYALRTGGVTGVGGIYLLPGQYYLASNVNLTCAFVEGIGVNNSSVRLGWAGADNTGNAFTRTNGVTGGSSFFTMKNLHFRNGANHPSIWLDFSGITTDTVDSYCRLNECQFFGGYTQVKIGRFVNVQWEHVRFDNWKSWGVHIIAQTGANQNTFRISGFTWDARDHGGSATGWMFVDNANNVSNLGTFHFQDARWEVNTNFTGVQGIIQLKEPAASANARPLKWHFDNITYQDVDNADGLMSNDVLIYVDAQGGTGVRQSVILENVSQNGLSAIVGGTAAVTGEPAIPLLSHYGLLAMGIGDVATGGVNPNPSVVTDMLALHSKTSGTNTNPVQLRKAGETYDALAITNAGDIMRNPRSGTLSAIPGIGLYVGSGVPAITASNGSLFQRTDGSGSTDNLYIRRGGAWVGIA